MHSRIDETGGNNAGIKAIPRATVPSGCNIDLVPQHGAPHKPLIGPPFRFVDRKTGHAIKLAMVNKVTGQHVRAKDILPQEGPGADELVRWRLTHFRK